MPRRITSILFLPGLVLCLLLGACRSRNPQASGTSELRIGVLKDTPPLIFLEHRKWQGIEADLGRALAKRLDRTPRFISLQPKELTEALLDGRVDILMAGLTLTEERQVQMDFAQPYLVTGQALLIRPGNRLDFNTRIKTRSTLRPIAVLQDSLAERLVTDYFPRARAVVVQTPEQAIERLQAGRVDAWISDAPAVWWAARQSDPPLLMPPILFAKEELAWGFRSGSVRLREEANQALKEWQKDGTLEAILKRWLPVSP